MRDSFLAYTGTRTPDLWLMLGDNAYDSGTDAEYQAKVFDVYTKTFKQSVVWPAVGNHDTNQSTSFDPTIAYYQIFTLPNASPIRLQADLSLPEQELRDANIEPEQVG